MKIREFISAATGLLLDIRVQFLNALLCFGLFLFLISSNLFNDTSVWYSSLTEHYQIELPIYRSVGPHPKLYTLKVTFDLPATNSKKLCISTNNRPLIVHLNGRFVPIDGKDKIRQCDKSRGFELNFEDYLLPRDNVLELFMWDRNGEQEVAIATEDNPILFNFFIPALLVSGLYLFWLIAKVSGVSTTNNILLQGGILIRCLYLSYTHYTERIHDVMERGGHLDYIKYLSEFRELPLASQGWEFHQPPLYYVFAAALERWNLDFGSIPNNIHLQVFSLLLTIGFVLAGIRIIEFLCSPGWQRDLAVTLFVFWPSSILHSVRIGNDQAMYFVFTLGLLFCVKSVQKRKDIDLFRAIVFSTLAIAVKANGLFNLILAGLTFLIRWRQDKKHRSYSLLLTVAFFLFTLSAGASFLRNMNHPREKKHSNALLESTGALHPMDEGLFVGNTWRNYVIFDIQDYLRVPYLSPWKDKGGRQYFLNFLFKSSLFGEWDYLGDTAKQVAYLINALSLFVILYFLFGLLHPSSWQSWEHGIVFIGAGMLFGSILIYRYISPVAPSNDFRFMMPSLIAFAVAINNALRNTQRPLQIFGATCIICFSLLSIVFFSTIST